MKPATQQPNRFYRDDDGVVASTELLALAAVIVIGLLVSFVTVRGAIISEISDVAGSVQDLNQSFQYQGSTSQDANVVGSQFADSTDVFDDPEDIAGHADNCIRFDVLPIDENGVAQNLLINPGFESGIDPSNATRTFGSTPNPRVYLFDEADVPGWQTTAPDGQIEVWESGFGGVVSQSDDYHVEINANTSAQLFQEFAVSPGDDLQYSVWHRGRTGVDTANVLIGPPGSQTVHQTLSTGTAAWMNYTGTYTVPAGVTSIRFGLESVNGGSLGNFIDNLEVFVVP